MRKLMALLCVMTLVAACKTTETAAPPSDEGDPSLLLTEDSDPEAVKMLEEAGIDVDEIAAGLSNGSRIRVRVNHKGEKSDLEVEAVTEAEPEWESDEELMRAIEATLKLANGEVGAEFSETDMLDIEPAPVASVSKETTYAPSKPARPSTRPAPQASTASRKEERSSRNYEVPVAEEVEAALETRRNSRVRAATIEADLFGRSSVLTN